MNTALRLTQFLKPKQIDLFCKKQLLTIKISHIRLNSINSNNGLWVKPKMSAT